ncbi:chromosome replication/partitioning protein (plasmid) [Borrelia sp. A-FGy1]|uniref:chromosome replication/partitioning protein n=1 Tax=Borrelia sp. A-FGy1 TaxID=2608247 RepID=UPI0015F47F0E|nr:chromosome replication/partitioning protein [Borrelia sp. A-FGy1]QMU99839.1 chromosome replication/partitioning protein [Borrelia sp. A-FGy1]
MTELKPNISLRVDKQSLYEEKEIKEQKLKKLIEKLKSLAVKDIRTKIEMIKTVFEIYDEKLYIVGGYNSFVEFIKTCGTSVTNAYMFIKVGKALKEGQITEKDIIERGIDHIKMIVKEGNYQSLKEGKAEKDIPLRILIPSKNAYSYFKSNTKFTSYVLSRIYDEHRQLLDTLFYDYNKEKKDKKKHESESVIEMGAERHIDDASSQIQKYNNNY